MKDGGLANVATGNMMNHGYEVSRRFRDCRVILSAGMPRSGSTWLYNAARLLLAKTTDDLSCGWIGDWRLLPVRSTVLLKVHDWDPFLAERAEVVLYSFRDLRDALASSNRKFGTSPTIETARRWIADDRHWRSAADNVTRYETMCENPRGEMEKLAAVLGVDDGSVDSVLVELETLNTTIDRGEIYDPVTLLHDGHITDGGHGTWNGWLPVEFARRVEGEFREWFSENGYPIGEDCCVR